MTYKEAKDNFVLFAVFVYKKDKKDKWKCEEVDLEIENIPDDTEGKIGAFEYGYGFARATRLCFIANKKENNNG